MLSYVNHNIDQYNEKYNKSKPYAIGFEVDKEHKDRMRFFDNNGKTVWLPDKLYKDINKIMMKSDSYRTTYVSLHWEKIASGTYVDVSREVQKRFKALKNMVVAKYKSIFKSDR